MAELGTLKADKSLRIIRSGIFPAIQAIRGSLLDLYARVNALEKSQCNCKETDNGV